MDEQQEFKKTSSWQELRSEEINDIITAVPSWIIRCGIGLVFFVLAGILLGAAWISFPEKTSAWLRVRGEDSIQRIFAREDSKIAEVFISTGQKVKKGTVIAWLDEENNFHELKSIRDEVEEIRKDVFEGKTPKMSAPEDLKTGSLKILYQKLYLKNFQFNAQPRRKFDEQRSNLLIKEISNAEEHLKRNRQSAAANGFKIKAHLYKCRQELLRLTEFRENQKFFFIQDLNLFLDIVRQRFVKYSIVAGIDGKLTYLTSVYSGKSFKEKELIFVIEPEDKELKGEVRLSEEDFPLIKSGQVAIIKFKSYSSQKYGVVRGHVEAIKEFTHGDSAGVAIVIFDLKSDIKMPIKIKPGMSAQVDIITKQSSLLSRFFERINVLN